MQHREPSNRRIDAVVTYAIPASDARLLHETPVMGHMLSNQDKYCTAMYVHETSLVPVLP